MAEIGDLLCSGRKSGMPVTLEMMEYEYIDRCDRVDELRSIYASLKSGEHGRYEQLEKHCEKKLFSLLPAKEQKVLQALKQEISYEEETEAKNAILEWTKSVKHHEAKLKEAQHAKEENASLEERLPLRPPRNQQSKTWKKKMSSSSSSKSAETSSSKKEARLSGYDFRAWEKFDVDKACEEIDEKEKKESEAGEDNLENKRKETRLFQLDELRRELAVTARSAPEREALANREKTKGNEEFRAGEFRQAYNSFSRSIAYLDTAIAYSNRALACIKLDLLQTAEDDCSTAMRIDPAYSKAQARRGMIRLRRGKYKLAIQDLDATLEKNHSNAPAIRKLRQEALAKLSESSGQHKKEAATTPNEKPFTRVPVTECDDSDHESQTLPPPPPSALPPADDKPTDTKPPKMVRVPIAVIDDDDDDDDDDDE